MRFVAVILLMLAPANLQAQEPMSQIVVTGTGVVSAAPDMAVLRIGVTREARTASEAMAGANTAAAKVLDAIDAAGIAPRDVQTASISLSPVWDHSNGRPPQARGYVASNDLTVRVRDLDGLGGLLDAVIGDGANMLNGLSFSIAEPGTLEAEARAGAVADARSKAETLATAADVVLGPVLQISEGGGMVSPAPMMRGAMLEAATPVATGELDIRVTVSMVFAIE